MAAIDRARGIPYLTFAMAILPILTVPDPLLRRESVAVERVDATLTKLIDDMLETMYLAPGIGLAAVQVGVPRRLLVLDLAKKDEPPEPMAMINPELLGIVGSELSTYEEGCLSIPDVYAEVERPASVRVKFLDRAGKQQELVCDGLLATVVQHEIDHLEGKLFIDYLSRLRRDRIIKKLVKGKRDGDD